MNQNDIANYRIANQRISGSAMGALEIVEYMGAMQAQDYSGALWSIGLRTGLTQEGVLASIQNRQIVRTWPQRGTLHFIPAKDAKWQVGLSAERLVRGATRRHEQLELSKKIITKSQNLIIKALSDGKALSRLKIMEMLEKAGINTKIGRGYHILWYLSQIGILVAGPMEAKQQTFVLLDKWIPNSITFTHEAGIAELAKRYFTSHGPATIQDFMWWSGLTAVDAKAGLGSNKPILTSNLIEGKEYWMKSNIKKPKNLLTSAFLLPGFDEYILGYKNRSAVLPLEHSNKIVPGGNGMFLPTIVINGQVVGTWKKEVKKNQVTIKLKPFRKLTKAEIKILEIPAGQYNHFLGLPSKLEVIY